jgi:hypothetical protein
VINSELSFPVVSLTGNVLVPTAVKPSALATEAGFGLILSFVGSVSAGVAREANCVCLMLSLQPAPLPVLSPVLSVGRVYVLVWSAPICFVTPLAVERAAVKVKLPAVMFSVTVVQVVVPATTQGAAAAGAAERAKGTAAIARVARPALVMVNPFISHTITETIWQVKHLRVNVLKTFPGPSGTPRTAKQSACRKCKEGQYWGAKKAT